MRITPCHLLALILLLHAALGVLYSVTVPPWEAHDEIGHYYFVEYLATEHHLPPPGAGIIEHNDESHQPPLYYIIAALATAWIDTSDDVRPVLNPYAATVGGDAGANMVVHDPAVEGFPYRGTILALHVARLVSVAISTLALLATYKLGRYLFPARPELALGATAINAFWPQYLFLGSVVTNDIMVTACASWLMLFLVRVLKRPRPGNWIGAGLLLGAMLASKNNALAFLPVVVLVGMVASERMIHRRGMSTWFVSGVLAVLGGLLASVGWWYGRNIATLGHPLGYYGSRAVSPLKLLFHPVHNLRHLPWSLVPAMLHYGFVSFWASFGWGNVGLVDSAYIAAAVFCALGVIGLLRSLIQDRARRLELSLLGFAVLSFVAALGYLNLKEGTHYLRGRLCLPIIAPVSLLLAIGWGGLSPLHWARWVMSLISAAMAIGTALLPFGVISPTYARPPQLTPEEVHAISYPLGVTFGDHIQLIGYDLDRRRVKPGERLPVTLYWRALGSMKENYTLTVKVIGHEGEIYGARHLFPGRGNFATSLWKEGDCFRETYRVPIKAKQTTRTLARVSVSFFHGDGSQKHLPARDARAESLGSSVLFGRIKIAGAPPRPVPSHEVSFQMGDRVSLIGYDLPRGEVLVGGEVELGLHWRARGSVSEDYNIFVHLVDSEGEIVAQGDGPPVSGSYPTGIWEEGEVIVDTHTIYLPRDLPSGGYQILVGLYRLDTLIRLPALTSDGERLTADAIPLGYIRVSHPDHRIFLPFVGRGK
ncbi:MAG: glycosyltransferase family 39 protein [Chloroflexota bacterium]|nr:glycosyltransferase family 39 protein [Chloroflexota bacterium]